MTLSDFWLVVRHCIRLVVIVPIVCAVLAGCCVCASDLMWGRSFKADATLSIADPSSILNTTSLSNLMNAIAQSETSAVTNESTIAVAESDAAEQSVTFTVSAASANDAVSTANLLTSRTAESIRQMLDDQSDAYLKISDEAARAEEGVLLSQNITAADRAAALRSCAITASGAKLAESSSLVSIVLKYALVGFVGGLFLVICALALFDSAKRPIKGRADVAEVANLPILAEGSSAVFGERLWANIQFVKEDAKTICIVPISGTSDGQIAATLSKAIEDYYSEQISNAHSLDTIDIDPPAVIECNALSSDIEGARVARESDITLLVVQPWSDTVPTLRNALAELKLAGASVEGLIVLCNSDKRHCLKRS